MGSMIVYFLLQKDRTYEKKKLYYKKKIKRLEKEKKRLINENSILFIKNKRFKLIYNCHIEPTFIEFDELLGCNTALLNRIP